jgi:hypothetical protein
MNRIRIDTLARPEEALADAAARQVRGAGLYAAGGPRACQVGPLGPGLPPAFGSPAAGFPSWSAYPGPASPFYRGPVAPAVKTPFVPDDTDVTCYR